MFRTGFTTSRQKVQANKADCLFVENAHQRRLPPSERMTTRQDSYTPAVKLVLSHSVKGLRQLTKTFTSHLTGENERCQLFSGSLLRSLPGRLDLHTYGFRSKIP